MSEKNYINFSKGEINQAFQRRVDIKGYDEGLAKARNVTISKVGSILSRPGTSIVNAVLDNRNFSNGQGERTRLFSH